MLSGRLVPYRNHCWSDDAAIVLYCMEIMGAAALTVVCYCTEITGGGAGTAVVWYGTVSLLELPALRLSGTIQRSLVEVLAQPLFCILISTNKAGTVSVNFSFQARCRVQ